MLWLLLLALVASLATTATPSTPPARPPDKNAVVEQCMTSGHRVGECMALLRREA